MISLFRPVGPETTGTYWVRRVRCRCNGHSHRSAIDHYQGRQRLGSEARSAPPPRIRCQPRPDADCATHTVSDRRLVHDSSNTQSNADSITQREVSTELGELPAKTRPTLTGRIRLAPRQRTTFQLSLINGSDQLPCARDEENFELKISSSGGRTWSTGTVQALSRRSAASWSPAAQSPGHSAGTGGSRSDCRSARPAPKPGRYVARTPGWCRAGQTTDDLEG
jgi:hypothetical protein